SYRGSGGSWWGSWLQDSLQSVKEKSTEALEFMKRDLAEFSHVIQHDTACTIAATANAVKEKLSAEGSSGAGQQVKKGLSNILGVLSDTFAPPPDKTIDCDVITLLATPSGTTEIYDSTKARLYTLQTDPATYCNEPDGPPELYDEWVVEFNLEERKGEISDLLVSSPSVRALYTKMVPAAVSHSEFWHRYFYKLHQLEQEEARRIALKQRAEQISQSEELRWEEEEDEFIGSSPTRTDLQHVQNRSLLSVEFPLPRSSVAKVDELERKDDADMTQTPAVLQSVSFDLSPTEPQLKNQVSTSSETSRSEETVKEIVKDLTETSSELVVEQELNSKVPESREKLSTVDKETDGSATETETETRASGDVIGAVIEAKDSNRPGTIKDEGPVDLRVYELNSDSGKSTPSNNGKKGSSTDISEDWEKDFDLDMTEEEVQLALSQVDASGQLEEDWENWE
uniref:BSD domain containing 1 n=1 Tax=Callorhinchus milii TaxID=7868 RepID=A0A4W3JQL9_CALMI